jgi:hypothetical protein
MLWRWVRGSKGLQTLEWMAIGLVILALVGAVAFWITYRASESTGRTVGETIAYFFECVQRMDLDCVRGGLGEPGAQESPRDLWWCVTHPVECGKEVVWPVIQRGARAFWEGVKMVGASDRGGRTAGVGVGSSAMEHMAERGRGRVAGGDRGDWPDRSGRFRRVDHVACCCDCCDSGAGGYNWGRDLAADAGQGVLGVLWLRPDGWIPGGCVRDQSLGGFEVGGRGLGNPGGDDHKGRDECNRDGPPFTG